MGFLFQGKKIQSSKVNPTHTHTHTPHTHSVQLLSRVRLSATPWTHTVATYYGGSNLTFIKDSENFQGFFFFCKYPGRRGSMAGSQTSVNIDGLLGKEKLACRQLLAHTS